MKHLICILALCSAMISNAQEAKQLYGIWVFNDIKDKDKADSVGAEMAMALFKGMTLNFESDGSYKSIFMGRPDEGTWELVEREIKLNSTQGSGQTFEVEDLSDDQLIIKFGKKSSLIMIRGSHEADTLEGLEYKEQETIEVTEEQLINKWFIVKTDDPKHADKSDEVKALAQALMNGSYFHFKPKGKFEVQVLGITEKAKWELSEDGKSVSIINDKNSRTWNFKSISSTDLVMYKGLTDVIYYFSIVKPAPKQEED